MSARLTRPLFSERMAIAQMSPARRRLHRAIRGLYWSIPAEFLFDGHTVRSRGKPILFLWRQYRRTWPRRSSVG